jgi:hypothetical protein
MSISKRFQHLHEIIFYVISISSFLLYFIVFFGLSIHAPQYLSYLEVFIKIYVSLFLIIRFNPFKSTYEFNDLDRKIAFSAGMLLLTANLLSLIWPFFIDILLL